MGAAIHISRHADSKETAIARFVFGEQGVLARTVTQVAPTSTAVATFYSVTQAKGIANPRMLLANVTNATISYRVWIAKGTNATSAGNLFWPDVTLQPSAAPAFEPLPGLENGDVVFIKTSVASALNAALLGYEIS